MFKIRLFLLLLFLLALPLAAQAQTATSTPTPPPNPNANITWPPPIYLLRGDFDVRGTANLPNMTTFFLEYRPLDEAGNVADENFPWIPATLPNPSAVVEDVLGTWDTTILPDGVYELRLTVNVAGGTPVNAIVKPLRIENEPPPFAITPTPGGNESPIILPTIGVTQPPAQPTLQATPTAFDPTPRGEVIVASGNVRSGDGVNYDIVGVVRLGDSVRILASSATGSGWWQVQLDNGRTGWVAPSLIRISGSTSGLPRIQPPPPPATPTPTFTPTPVSQANMIINSITLDPNEPRCDQTFTITARVQNVGTTATNADGILSLQDAHVNTGNITATTVGGFPILQPGQQFDVIMRLTVNTYFEENHRLTAFVDANNVIIETNDNDNFASREYNLRRAGC